jgi:hypothetical protein
MKCKNTAPDKSILQTQKGKSVSSFEILMMPV